MNKKEMQQGYTLVELMIVVTIIGILASIAVPIYRDYTIRTRVAEAVGLFAPIKTEYGLRFSELGELPPDKDALEKPGRLKISEIKGDYVASVGYVVAGDPPTKGTITFTLNSDTDLGPAADKVLQFIVRPRFNSLNWTVSSTADTEVDSLPAKYWP